MVGEAEGEIGGAAKQASQFPPANFPTLYMDGFANIAPQGSVIKLYIYRSDVEMTGLPENKPQIFAQVIMPVSAFIQSALFLHDSLEKLVKNKHIEQSLVDTIRISLKPPPPPESGG